MKSDDKMEAKLANYSRAGLIVPRTENNQYLKVSYKGAGTLVSSKWNVKIYNTGSVVCNDMILLHDLLKGRFKPPDETKTLLQIDDAGGGFPLCGVMVGIASGDHIETDVVDVSFFQGELYERKRYLREYAGKGLNLVQNKFHGKPETHRIEICTGFINTILKSLLRKNGFDVRVVEIKGLLQDKLEQLFKEYVMQELQEDLAFDPKELGNPRLISQHYYKAVAWGRKNAPHLLKTGWKALSGG